MKRIIFILAAFLAAASCIEDHGNYDYDYPEVPKVTLEESYTVTLGEPMNIEPEVVFSDESKLSFEWSISDPDQMKSHIFEGKKLDAPFGLKALQYNAMLTVTDQSTGVRYFHTCKIIGQTEFSEGIILLTSRGGQSELSFIKPDYSVIQDVYGKMNDGDELPDGPLQLVRIYNQNMMNGLYLGYWIICSDTDEAGVLVDPDDLRRIRTLRENFSTPPSEISVSSIIPIDDNGTMTGIVNGKMHVGNFEGYYKWPSYNYFTSPIIGDYQIECLVKDKTAGFCWGYDPVKKRLHAFMAAARMLFDVTNIPGPPAQWDPANIGLDLVTLQFHAGGGYLIGRDGDGKMWQLAFMTGGQMTMNTTIIEFQHTGLITADTKWLLGNNGVFFFTSGEKIYRYNPASPSVAEELVTKASGEITMLKFGRSTAQNELVVGCEGHLYWLNITGAAGNDGTLLRTQTDFEGTPIDLFDHRDIEKYPL